MQDVIDTESKLEKSVWKTYHWLALFSFLLSMNVVITASATANMLLLTQGADDSTPGRTFSTVYEYLKEVYEYEFTLVRWSFFSGILM